MASRTRTLLLFFTVLGAIAFFVGDTGVFSDDYFCNQREPETGGITHLTMNRPWHPWRPLTRLVLPPIVTVFWNHPWALHVISAALHALVIGLFYRLLRRLDVAPGIAAPVSAALLVYPVFFEIVLWNALIATLFSVVVVLLIWHLFIAWLTTEKPPFLGWRIGALLAFAALTFAAAALNEQPVGALVALPFAPAALGASPRSRYVARSIAPIVSCATAAGLYCMGLFRHLHRIGGVLSRDEHSGIGGLMHRIREAGLHIPREMGLADFGRGALSEGMREIAGRPWQSMIVCATMIGLAWPWLFQARRTAKSARSPSAAMTPRWRALMLLGLGWALGAWIPVIVSYSVLWPRLHYMPAIGLAAAVAAVGSAVSQRIRFGSIPLLLARLGLASSVGASVIVWIGLQANYQRRWRADGLEAAALKRVFSGSMDPGVCFVPVRVDSRTAVTGSARFDDYFRPAWSWAFSSGWRLQSGMGSSRVFTVHTDSGVQIAASDDHPELFAVIRAPLVRPKPMPPLAPARDGFVAPWDRLVLFAIDAPGSVRIFTRLRIHPLDRQPFEIVPRQIAIAAAATNLPPCTLDVYPATSTPSPVHR